MKTEVRMNMFHLATKRLYTEVKDGKRIEVVHKYRDTESGLYATINTLGLFFATVLKDDKGYYMTSPFDLQLVFKTALKIRSFLDRKKRGITQVLFTQSQISNFDYVNKGKSKNRMCVIL
jgi:hypothetical protein